MAINDKGNKTVEFLKQKLEKMSESEREAYANKMGLKYPSEGISEEFVDQLYQHIKQGARVSKSENKRHNKFGYGLRDLGAKNHHWIDNIQDSGFKITKPVMICLPGNGSITCDKANGFCKIIERMLGLNHEIEPKHSSYENFDIIGIYYGTNEESETAGTINAQESTAFVEHLLIPLCVDNNGNALTLNEVCTNMSLINFCSHCYGAVALDVIMNTFSTKLSNLGFDMEDIKTIKSYMCQITYSPYIESASVPTVRIDSMTDSFHKGLDEEYNEAYGHYLDGVEIQYDNPGMFRNKPCNNTNSFEMLHIFTSRLLNLEDNRDFSQLIDEHTIEYLGREEDWNISEKSRNAKNANLVSIMMAYAISWAGTRSLTAKNSQSPQIKTGLNTALAAELEDLIEMYSESELRM